MNEKFNSDALPYEIDDAELDHISGGHSVGDHVNMNGSLNCYGCRGSVPGATLKIDRGTNPNGKHTWVAQADCCGTTIVCDESNIKH